MKHHKLSILNQESIIIGSGLTDLIADEISKLIPKSCYVIVTDSNIQPLHLDKLVKCIETKISLNSRLLTFVIPPGEVYKTRETKASIEDFMLSQAVTRDTCMIALGGGVIGDLVGFVAATFMRGIPIIQIPTTLLAMVDSSVGGKTAIDTPNGKNLIGSFHQPFRIYIDIDYLKTLPKREFVNGLAEVIKTAAIWNQSDFMMLEQFPEKILSLNQNNNTNNNTENDELIVKVILGSVQVKAHVVTIDEKETGLRGLLNFGHTVGHAIEAIVFPDLLHGECVSIGMVLEAEISRHLGHLQNISVGRLVSCLQSYGLPVSLHDKIYKERTSKRCSVEQMLNIMKVDKKNKGDQKRIVLLEQIGKTLEPHASFVKDDVIIRVISPAVRIISPSIIDDDIKINVPGSKSISNRALLMAALGSGPCRLHGLLHSDDVKVMLDALQKLVGITFNWENGGDTLVINGGKGQLQNSDQEIYLGNAGTASRFLTTVCALIKGDETQYTVLNGNARMQKRPIGPLIEALQENNVQITCLKEQGYFPLKIFNSLNGLKGGKISLSAKISSQYVSSILLSAPYASQEVILELTGDKVISQPYIDMTIAMMKEFGINVERIQDSNTYRIPLGVYKNPADYFVEADASSATYPLAFAAITGAKVTVTNIGSKSLQGDAQFATKVLAAMGCEVHQSGSTTSVKGPKILRPLPSIDMESMTDAFMTATVLAAVAQNEYGEDHVTKITGIANQRVKECNRIAAMVEELSHLGVSCSELPDGIQINGIDRKELKNPYPNAICCYDDHRIAMSFAVLSNAYPQGSLGPIITEKKCVEKTWPSWWDALSNTLNCTLVGSDVDPPVRKFDTDSNVSVRNKSIILIGMRGAGKTHMGRAAAKQLNLKFIDMDVFFEEQLNIQIPKFVEEYGWDQFRVKEVQYLEQVLIDNATDSVIACGGGIIETEAGRRILKQWSGLVVQIKRDLVSIAKYLNIDTTRPAYGEAITEVWERRQPHYDDCSNAEFVVVSGDDAKKEHFARVETNFVKFLTLKRSSEPFQYPSTDLSFFICLTSPNVQDIVEKLPAICVGVNALELRVDLLESYNLNFVGMQIALIRHHVDVPIVYTVRTQSQGGRFPNNHTEEMISLLNFGLKSGCEYIDVEFTEPYSRFDHLIAMKQNSRIIGSYHNVDGTATWDAKGTMVKLYKDLHARSDIVKIIGRALTFQDNFSLFTFVNQVIPNLGMIKKPIIALLMGAEGQLSRHLNTFLTPVTHSELPISAAPGQVSIKQIHETRANLGLLPPKQFCLFGCPIAQSMSPTIHNTGFELLGLPYHYSLNETASWSDLAEAMKNIDGASVTIPLKIDVLTHNVCDHVDEAACKIGAINTLHKVNGEIFGSNTDWIGIKRCIENFLDMKTPAIGIVLGAGGTSRAALFALQSLPIVSEIRIWNRTFEKAEMLATEFGAHAVKDLRMLLKNEKQRNLIVVGTIPAAAQESLPLLQIFAEADNYSMGICVDMAYRPRDTKLIVSARNVPTLWHTVEGIDVLMEQGFEQFKIWTGIAAPKREIYQKVMEKY